MNKYKKTYVILLLLFLFSTVIYTQTNAVEYKDYVVVDNLDTPWSIDFLPNGNIIFTERPGKIKIFNGDTVKVIGQLEVTEVSESGLLGVAVDPDFAKNNFIYLYYTYNQADNSYNRISRFHFDSEIRQEEILIDNIPFAKYHDGGRIKFGPDNKLYITTGDALKPNSAQDINSLAGKILRINKDGSIPKDNPFDNYIYSYGHRNSQGLAWHKDKLFASEHGPFRHDEINMIVKGGNYGWPATCEEQDKQTRKPLKCYLDFTLAPSGITFFRNKLYIACLRGKQLREITFTDDYKIKDERVILDNVGRIRTVVKNDSALFIATNNRDGRGNPGKYDDKLIKLIIND